MNDYELAIRNCKLFESLLEQGFGATGKGLHEKVSSVQSRLPEPLVKRLRYIATIRNKLVHESTYEMIDDQAGFLRACSSAESELRAMLQPPATKKGCFGLFSLLVVMSIIGLMKMYAQFA